MARHFGFPPRDLMDVSDFPDEPAPDRAPMIFAYGLAALSGFVVGVIATLLIVG